ncbi:hypothetical protein FH972_021563 [Carpinus fangiana]|uniref:Histone acetyltransferase n=1 Tax=Carpinus fangiana TaxID=176857 RepID=A0A5N6KPP6_9ROSI|nr:hypothetical protein FH972_021563 [Carpinus fangiana]
MSASTAQCGTHLPRIVHGEAFGGYWIVGLASCVAGLTKTQGPGRRCQTSGELRSVDALGQGAVRVTHHAHDPIREQSFERNRHDRDQTARSVSMGRCSEPLAGVEASPPASPQVWLVSISWRGRPPLPTRKLAVRGNLPFPEHLEYLFCDFDASLAVISLPIRLSGQGCGLRLHRDAIYATHQPPERRASTQLSRSFPCKYETHRLGRELDIIGPTAPSFPSSGAGALKLPIAPQQPHLSFNRVAVLIIHSRNGSTTKANAAGAEAGAQMNGDHLAMEIGNSEDAVADASDEEMAEGGRDEQDDYAESESEVEVQDDAGAVKIPTRSRRDRNRKVRVAGRPVSESDASAPSGLTSDEEEEVEDWEAESDAEQEADATASDPNCCIYCGETEDNDPSEEYEEYLACVACGDNAHRQCARDNNSLTADEDADVWRCGACVANHIEPDTPKDEVAKQRRRSSTQKLTRDLLPASRGSIKPGSHSVFNTLILDDDPMDGSRSLRKRKSSNEAHDKQDSARKKTRRSAVEYEKNESAIVDDSPNGVAPESDVTPRARPARARGQRKTGYLAMVIESTEDSLIMSFKINFSRLANERRKRKRRDRDKARRSHAAQTVVEEETSHYPALQTSNFTHFYAFNDKDGEEAKSKPYGGILSEYEADTTKTFPQASDRKKFEDVRLKAEDDWRDKLRKAAMTETPRPSQKVSGPPSKIKCIQFGDKEIDTWHAAPYPEEYSRNKVLHICEYCLKYMNSDYVAWRHKLKCPAKHPPGDEIYRDGQFSFFEVDGRKNPVYCQNLCLLAKLFLGSKTLYYDVEPFLFYIMTENNDTGSHFVGYFSKEKRPSSQNNVSCILVLPIHQRRGFGHMLIDFSYMLTKVEKKTGSPEKPLSDMGLVSYRTYWRLILCTELLDQKKPLSISDISDRTGMTADDIVCALEGLRALVRDPVTKTYALRLDLPYFRQYMDNHDRKGYTKLDPGCLIWVPYVMGRDNMHYENAPPLHTVAQRDEEEADDDEATPLATNNVSERDYAGSIDELAEDYPATSQEHDSTPFPPLVADHAASPSKKRPSLSKAHSTSTAPADDSDPGADTSPIPTTRFEVFPPLPFARKRGRPPGSRTRNRSSLYTRARPNSFGGGGSPGTAHAPSSLRRSRTALDQEISGSGADDEDGGAGQSRDDEDDDEVDDDDEVEIDEVSGADEDGEQEQSGNEEDAEGDADEDAEGDPEGEDVDAEGSPDPDA